MRYFPIFIDLQDRHVIVVGGGEEATRKIRLLLKTPARISVIAPTLTDELKGNNRVEWLATAFSPTLLLGASLVYSADPALNAVVSAAAFEFGIPVNAVDDAAISSFIVPSIVDRDPVVVAIGTEGTAPVLGQGLRAKVDALLPQKIGELAVRAAGLRARVATSVPRGIARRNFWQDFFFGAPREALFEADDVAFTLAVDDAIHQAGQSNRGHVTLLATGPGDADLLTLKGQRKLLEADVIIYDRATPPAVLEMARRDALRIAAPTRAKDVEKLLITNADAGLAVVRLISGWEQNEQAAEECAHLQAQGTSAGVVQGLIPTTQPSGLPFPSREDIQDQILRSAS